jgi:hypothetical protein
MFILISDFLPSTQAPVDPTAPVVAILPLSASLSPCAADFIPKFAPTAAGLSTVEAPKEETIDNISLTPSEEDWMELEVKNAPPQISKVCCFLPIRHSNRLHPSCLSNPEKS